MAPEQAKGKPVDKRADIWSWGVVLYELLTGERLFKGEDMADTLARVLTREPDLKRAPPRVRRLLRRCLEKDPKQRLRDIGEVRHLLDEPAVPIPAPSQSRLSWLAWSIAGALTLALATLSFIHFREAQPDLRAVNTTLLPSENAEFDFNSPYALPALSPDGTRAVFGARAKEGKLQLWLRRLDSATAQPLPGTEDASFPFWSPDSGWVAFGQGNKLKKISIQGGPRVPLTDLSADFRGGSWNPDGVIIFGINAVGPILRVSAAGGTAVPATVLSGDSPSLGHRFPWFLPDGRHFLYTDSQQGQIPVRVGSLDEPGRPGKLVARVNSTVQYAQGNLLYLRENTFGGAAV